MQTDDFDAMVHATHNPAAVVSADEKHGAQNQPVKVLGQHAKKSGFYADGLEDDDGHIGQEGDTFPTEEELHTLRRVPDTISLAAYSVALVELCERFSYYGTQVLFQNFVQRPLPPGSRTGAAGTHGQAGALGKGQQTATAVSTFNQFWMYTTPLLGAYIADTWFGRYKTICIALVIAIVAHLIIIVAALPPVLENPNGSLACFVIGILVLGLGTGGFKPNVSALVVEQLPLTKKVVRTNKKGERVIHDPALTSERVYMYFYMFINVGALVGQFSMTYAEKYVGFWLGWTLPTVVFCLCPIVMFWGRTKYRKTPPAGSVLFKAVRLWTRAQRGRWSINPFKTWKQLHGGAMWDSVKPSNIPVEERPVWMTFDDAWVDEVRRGFAACAVFTWYPLFWLCYNQINNNLVSQAATMELHGLPNDIISNINPFSLIVLIPIFDRLLYPGLRKLGFVFTPIKRITAGFACASLSMVWAAVLQFYIYEMNPCGKNANSCVDPVTGHTIPATINIGAQTGAFVLVAISEIFASVTSLEYAYTKAPKNMRSLVQAVALFTTAISAALGWALLPLSEDPLLVWNYTVPAILAAFGGTMFYIQFRHLDHQEDMLNELPTGQLVTSGPAQEESVSDDEKEKALA